MHVSQAVLSKSCILPDRESNPGLPRDRRRSSPLDYRGMDRRWGKWKKISNIMSWLSNVGYTRCWHRCRWALVFKANTVFVFRWKIWKKGRKRLVPSSRIWTSDLWISARRVTTTVHRSTNWAIEGSCWVRNRFVNLTTVAVRPFDFPRQKIQILAFGHQQQEGDVAQMVERSLSMREVRGSIPRISKQHFAIAHETCSSCMETNKWLTPVCLGDGDTIKTKTNRITATSANNNSKVRKKLWQRWDSNPRPRKDWCLKPAP